MIAQNSQPAWLPLLRKPYDDLLGSRTAWQLSLPGSPPIYVERGGRGLNSSLYRVRVGNDLFACKLFVADERRRGEREWFALSALQAAGLKVAPKPITFAPEGPLPLPAIVVDWQEGVTLTQQPPLASDIAHLVALLADVHRVAPAPDMEFLPAYLQPPNYEAYLCEVQSQFRQVQTWAADGSWRSQRLPVWANEIPELLPLAEQVLAAAQDAVGRAGTDGHCRAPHLIRADGNLDGVLRLTGGNLVILDWTCSGRGDPAYDLAGLRWHPQSLKVPAATWTAALEAYPAPAGEPEFGERLATYNRLVPAWWIARSMLHLLEGAGQIQGKMRLSRVPARFYRSVRHQLDMYLAGLGMIAAPEEDDEDGD